MDRESVREYVGQSEDILDSSPQMDEANTKAAVLRNFLDLLNWEIPKNTQLEYSVEAFGQTYKVDYALILEGTPVAFLEAKGADTSLTTKHEKQLSSYMTNKNVTYGVLSNGKEYRFFQRRVDASNVDVQKVGDVALSQLPPRLTVLKAYEKEAIESGEAGKILGRINKLKQARRTLQTEKDELAEVLAEALADRVSETISSLAESQSKEMIDRLVDDIDAEINTDGGNTDNVVEQDDAEPLVLSGNAITGRIHRSEIDGPNDAKVAVFPTQESGLPFLKENNAWGFVRVGSDFEYIAMYVTGDIRQVKYFATVSDIVPPEEADLKRPIEEYVDEAKIAEGKRVIRFEPNSLYELENPVPFETKYPQSLQYTTLGALKSAGTTNDML